MSLRKYDKEWLTELCQESYSLAEVLRKAGRKQGGGAQATLRKKIEEFKIDTSHFTGQLWNKGKTIQEDARIGKSGFQEQYQIEDIFIVDSPVTRKVIRDYIKRHNLLEYKCQNCGCDGHWQNGIISLELDHINGINNDNRLENLRYLCPNCHALTDTYCGKNIKRK